MKILLTVILLFQIPHAGPLPKPVPRKNHMPAARRLKAYAEARHLTFYSQLEPPAPGQWCAYLDKQSACVKKSEGGLDLAVTRVIKLYEKK